MSLTLTPSYSAFVDNTCAPQTIQIAGGIAPYTAVSANTAIATVGAVTTSGLSYTTLNPSDKSAAITLSGGNLIATTTSTGAWANVRDVQGLSSGKWYWEVTITAKGPNCVIGIGNASAGLGAFIGSDANSWGYYTGAQKLHGGSFPAYGATFTTGDIIGVALDLTGGTLTFYKNGVSQGTAYSTGLTGTLYPMLGGSFSGTGSVFTVNFGATAFSMTPPAGFSGVGVGSGGFFTLYPVAPGSASYSVTDSTP